ncbi:hypothetical protein Y032_0099g3192 [Ancylostoma ceylanicum]|uniref:Uncharacterized protein n=1 Tax=Ancylostoma ceylanicum TaxID=53326 RepID=A0A016TIW5_9BILA|nr:hypothetical protein Y032_0099g3192 [Ancylostoma ceylanicum]
MIETSNVRTYSDILSVRALPLYSADDFLRPCQRSPTTVRAAYDDRTTHVGGERLEGRCRALTRFECLISTGRPSDTEKKFVSATSNEFCNRHGISNSLLAANDEDCSQ